MLGAGDITDVARDWPRASRRRDRAALGARVSLTTARALRTLLTEARSRALGEIFGERVRFDEPLAPLHVVEDRRPGRRAGRRRIERDGARAVMRWCFKRQMPWFVLGGGSNVLVGDGGMRGIVVRLGGEFAAAPYARETDAWSSKPALRPTWRW